DVARITHHNEEAYVGALAIVHCVRRLAADEWPLDGDLAVRLVDVLPDTLVRDRIARFADSAPTIEDAATHGTSGYVVDVVPLAVVVAQAAAEVEFRAAIERAIACGGDTDTIAAIAGQLIGAALGRISIPDDLIEEFDEAPDVEKVGDEFQAALSHS
ncbi:MAG: ADP-ribosylglycohydrolase family protein, partial [Persicimonas sp.]